MELYYPPVSFFFRVAFLNIKTVTEDARFQSVSGLSSEVVTETYKEGGQNQFDHELPMKIQHPNLVLKRGLLAPKTSGSRLLANDIQQWCLQMMETLIVRPTDIKIDLLNPAGNTIMSWDVIHAWPKKWLVSDFDAEENQIAIETMELHYDSFRLI